MFEIKLNERQLRDLQLFLENVPLRGADYPRFGAIVAAIREAQDEYMKKNAAPLKKEVEAEVIVQ